MFIDLLKQSAARDPEPEQVEVHGSFIRGEVGRTAIRFEALNTDAADDLEPFWLEVGEQACELCHLALKEWDFIIYGAVVDCGSHWHLTAFDGLEVV